jgi:anti-sigma factor RsiW
MTTDDVPPPTSGVPLPSPEDDLPCAVFVEMVTDYLEGAIPADLRARLEAHLALCDGCHSVLAQIERIVQLAGRVTEEDVQALPNPEREELIAAFRVARSEH